MGEILKAEGMNFQRALFDRSMWHDVDEDEVRRVFTSNTLLFRQLLSGAETQSPNGTGIIYRISQKQTSKRIDYA